MSVRATVCKTCGTSLMVLFTTDKPPTDSDVEDFFRKFHQNEPHTEIRKLYDDERVLYENLKASLRKERPEILGT